jgi:hypothetical protein
MGDTDLNVEFQPVETKCGTGWFVRIKLPHPLGARIYIDGFPTRHDAEEWIRIESPEWLRKFEGGGQLS